MALGLSAFLCVWGTLSPVAAAPNVLKPVPHCNGSFAGAGENIPTNTTDDGHSVKHIASVVVDGVLVGWIYGDVNRTMWFQVVTGKATEKSIVAARVLGATMPNQPSGGTVVPLLTPFEPWALGKRIEVQSCF